MKQFLYIISIICSLNKAVTAEFTKDQQLMIDPIDYGSEKTYYTAGVRKSIICKGVSKNQKVEWIDPSGKPVPRQLLKRVFTQEHFIPSLKTRIPALVLVFTRALVEDTGVWTCRSGDFHREVPICVIDPADFVNTPMDVTVDRGRSITLSCQAKGEPEPRIMWYRNGQLITDESNPMKYKVMKKFNDEGFEGLLTIVALEGKDSGLYVCNALQEGLGVEECTTNRQTNVTLHVNYPPIFEDGNDTSLVPGKENESVDLVCSVNGYPIPKYRWFKDVGEALSEYSKDEIKILDAGEQSVLTVIANESSYGQRFICRATNQYGTVEKVFKLFNMERPEKPNEIIVVNATSTEIMVTVTWVGLVVYPIDELHIQFMEKKHIDNAQNLDLDAADWKQSNNILIKDFVLNRKENSHSDILVTLKDLEAETEYCIRVRASNDVGVSPWSEVTVASTNILEVEESPQETMPEAMADIQTNSTFYGIFFACGICVIAIAYMFAIRLV